MSNEQIKHPINAFPLYVQEIINHYSEAKGYPIEWFIQSFLGAASTAMGRSLTLNTGNYTSIANLWCIILGKKGFNKSEPLKDAFKPVRKYQIEMLKIWQAQFDELEEYKANNPKAKVAELPKAKKVVLSDVTPEKLVMILADNPKGCGMVYDEIAGFVGRFNRYSSGSDEQMFLSLFNGDSITRDRMSGADAYAEHSYLTIIGSTQPSVLKDVFSGKSASGFFDRWLISRPDSVVKPYPNLFGINPVEEGKYTELLYRLLRLEYQPDYNEQMTYTAESGKLIRDYQCEIINVENATDDDELRGILAKMEIYLHKFALICQMIEYAVSGDFIDMKHVSVNSANGAIILTEYFIAEAKKVRVATPEMLLKDQWNDVYAALPSHGVTFDRKQFLKICSVFKFGESAADKFLKEHGLRSETSLLYKVKHGVYTKNLF